MPRKSVLFLLSAVCFYVGGVFFILFMEEETNFIIGLALLIIGTVDLLMAVKWRMIMKEKERRGKE